MMKKHSSHKTLKRTEEKVENIYGVHFDYEDLCSRLLKVQKAQRRSEAKSPKTRVFSTESVKLKRDDSSKKHKIDVFKKNTDLSLNPGKIKDLKSPSNKKNKSKSKSIKKQDTIKAFSPRDVRKKISNALTSKKKIDKTFSSTSKLVKKTSSSLLKKEKLTNV
jgi:hypothetical protein